MIITPATTGGSWLFLEDIIKNAKSSFNFFILSLSRFIRKEADFKYFSIPYPKYDRWGLFLSSNILLAFIFELPLFFYRFFCFFLLDPT
jgi:hypothetical protein